MMGAMCSSMGARGATYFDSCGPKKQLILVHREHKSLIGLQRTHAYRITDSWASSVNGTQFAQHRNASSADIRVYYDFVLYDVERRYLSLGALYP